MYVDYIILSDFVPYRMFDESELMMNVSVFEVNIGSSTENLLVN